MANSKKVPKEDVVLSACKAEPTMYYDTSHRYWTARLTLEQPGVGFLPLFVHVYSGRNREICAELESDQTDYDKPGMESKIRRATLKRLRFFTKE